MLGILSEEIASGLAMTVLTAPGTVPLGAYSLLAVGYIAGGASGVMCKSVIKCRNGLSHFKRKKGLEDIVSKEEKTQPKETNTLKKEHSV